MSRTDPMLRVRLSASLKEWIEAEAKRNCRSTNGEIVYRLETDRLRAERAAQIGGAPAADHAVQT